MERVLQGTTATIGVTFQVDGNATDPAPTDVTVQVTRSDGTDLLAPDTTATRTAAGTYTYNLQTVHTTLLDQLTATWTSGNLGTLTTRVEVVGGFLFSIGQLRAASPTLQDPAKYPTGDLISMRTVVEDALESELGYALVPRFARSRTTNDYVKLKPYVRAIRSVTSDASTVDASMLTFSDTGFVTGYRWRGVTTVTYEHGLDGPSPRATAEALTLARSWLIRGPIDDRVTTVSSPDTGITSVLAVPGRGGSIFGVPSVDAFVQSERLVAVA